MSLIHTTRLLAILLLGASTMGCPLDLNCEMFVTFAEGRGQVTRSSTPNQPEDIVLSFETIFAGTNRDFDGLDGRTADFLKFCLASEPGPRLSFLVDARPSAVSTQSGTKGPSAAHNPACFFSHGADEPGMEPYVSGSLLVDGELIILRSFVATWRSRDPILLDVVFEGDTESGEQWTFDVEVTSGTAGNSVDCAG